MLTKNQLELTGRIDCSRCHIRTVCDQIKSECPKADFRTLTVNDDSILTAEAGKNLKNCDGEPPGFIEITRREFEKHLYGNITGCRDKNKILSFFSSEKEVQDSGLFFFSHRGRYYRALRDTNLTGAALEQQVMNFLYPAGKSFMYSGWLCRFDRNDLMFHLYTPAEPEQPPGVRYSEFEAFSPAQAIEFINCR
jgi:hypothetical protein